MCIYIYIYILCIYIYIYERTLSPLAASELVCVCFPVQGPQGRSGLPGLPGADGPPVRSPPSYAYMLYANFHTLKKNKLKHHYAF